MRTISERTVSFLGTAISIHLPYPDEQADEIEAFAERLRIYTAAAQEQLNDLPKRFKVR